MCLGSCLGSCCATCGCEAVKACCPSCSGKNMSRLPYIAVMFCSTLLAIILRYYGGPILVHMYVYDLELCTSDKCVGFGAVYRISFAMFVWFLCIGLLLLAPSCFSLDRNHWFLKLFCYFALLVISWLIPNSFYEVYVHIARVISGIFLFLQILILLDFAISLNEDLVDKKDWKAAVLGLSVALYGGSLVLLVFMFQWFTNEGTCAEEKFILAFTIITTFIFTMLSLSKYAENRGGILPAAVMSMYIHYVAYSALSSDPSECNSLHDTSTVQLIIGLIIAALSISYAAWNLATSNSLFGDPKDEDEVRAEKEEQLNKAAASGALGTAQMNNAAAAGDAKDAVVVPVAAKTDAPAAAAEGAAADKPAKASAKSVDVDSAAADRDEAEDAKHDLAHSTRNARFHFVMAAAAMYMAMILTNWSNYKVGVEESRQTSDFGLESMWIKVVSQWVTVLLYIWWLLAPIICGNRDFSNDS